MSAHTPAPWPQPNTQMFAFDAKLGSELKAGLLSLSDYLRARACVNACEGISDPAEYVRLTREHRVAAELLCGEATALRARCDVLEAALRGMVGMARLERDKPAWQKAADIAEDTLRVKVRSQP